MGKNKYHSWNHEPLEGVIGCRFSLAIMSDEYASKILGAIHRVNTQNVWSCRDVLSSTYCGKIADVVDALKACFMYANDGETHMTLEATFSYDNLQGLEKSKELILDENGLNQSKGAFQVISKVSFYPMGVANPLDFMPPIIKLAKDKGLYQNSLLNMIELTGDVNELFEFFQSVLNDANEKGLSYALTTTLSVNSPSQRKKSLLSYSTK